MLLLRLCPLIPFNGLNYALGITGVSCEDYLWALMIGSLPMQLLTVIMGATTEALYRQRYNESFYNDHTISSFGQKVAYCVLLFLGVFWAIVAVVYTWKKVKKELKKVRENQNFRGDYAEYRLCLTAVSHISSLCASYTSFSIYVLQTRP